MHDDDAIRLRHMPEAACEALSFIQQRARTDLDTDRQLVLSLVKDIEIIGEAANGIAESTRQSFPDVPWKQIIGMRHRLVHAYFDINLDILWRTAREELPMLIAHLESVVSPDME